MMSVLHTIVPLDAVFPGDPPNTEWTAVNGAFVEGTRGPDGVQITRLISTDPKMYLDKRYQVGCKLPRGGVTG